VVISRRIKLGAIRVNDHLTKRSWGQDRSPQPPSSFPGLSLQLQEMFLVFDIRRIGCYLGIALLHSLGIYENVSPVDIAQETSVAIRLRDILLQHDRLALYWLPVLLIGFLSIMLNRLRRMV